MANPFEKHLSTPLTAKRMILSVLSATGQKLSTGQLTHFGELAKLDPGAVRVALGRLVKNHDLVIVSRGVYALGEKGEPILSAVRRWVELPECTKRWGGGWVVVHTAQLGRTQRTQLRRRERALALFGFAPLQTGLWLRPDNLAIDIPTLRERLVALGLQAEAFVMATTQILPEPDIARLWDRTDLEAGYLSAKKAMQQCLRRFDAQPVTWRANEAARIGSAVIGMLTFDPLLPRELVDSKLRDEVHRLMLRFDEEGKRALAEFWSLSDE